MFSESVWHDICLLMIYRIKYIFWFNILKTTLDFINIFTLNIKLLQFYYTKILFFIFSLTINTIYVKKSKNIFKSKHRLIQTLRMYISVVNQSPDGEEKKQREHLLQMNQILAKQVTEMSKIIAGENSALLVTLVLCAMLNGYSYCFLYIAYIYIHHFMIWTCFRIFF